MRFYLCRKCMRPQAGQPRRGMCIRCYTRFWLGKDPGPACFVCGETDLEILERHLADTGWVVLCNAHASGESTLEREPPRHEIVPPPHVLPAEAAGADEPNPPLRTGKRRKPVPYRVHDDVEDAPRKKQGGGGGAA